MGKGSMHAANSIGEIIQPGMVGGIVERGQRTGDLLRRIKTPLSDQQVEIRAEQGCAACEACSHIFRRSIESISQPQQRTVVIKSERRGPLRPESESG